MAASMTGLGVGQAQKNGYVFSIELRSVNNRFLEVSCRLPACLAPYERDVREMIRQEISRGKIYVQATVQSEADSLLDIRVDPRMTAAVKKLLNELKDLGEIQEPVTLDHLLKFSEIFTPSREHQDEEVVREGAGEALRAALAALKRTREQEGEILIGDIRSRLRALESNLDRIAEFAETHVAEAHARMIERVKKLAESVQLNDDRLYTEITILSDKMDITEEIVRLRSHYQLFTETIDKEDEVGKRLNFLLQEINREVNTISSKANHFQISHLVVEMKEQIEKIREQVQNLE